ncbi:HAMP domain-containing histidine kinase [Thiospirochaeta perfilievii]|uniref:histidine kinase n=1 Tax=Thiospirochaeta perfilievii TaxID=252967 RepID=A0A5C1QAC1_9SPIO|nr:HAMP domain-containing sensor histidine kinase [Thiospirochaeta perfilievii]QEN04298.1 HAMP domain-containing histidine kinase [Thiospirochaeta perfilievii]
MIRSIRVKFVTIFSVLILLPLLIVGIVFTNLYKSQIEYKAVDDQKNYLLSIKNHIERRAENETFDIVETRIKSVKYTLIVVTDKCYPINLINPQITLNKIDYNKIIESDKGIITLEGKRYFSSWLHIPSLNLDLISLLPYRNVATEIIPIQLITAIVIIIALILAVFAGLYISKNIVSKIESVNKHVFRIASGDYSKESSKNSHDEFETLNSSLNVLADNFLIKIRELEHLNSELDSVIELRTLIINLLSKKSTNPITYLYNTSFDMLQQNWENPDFKLLYNSSRDLKSLNENMMALLKLDEGLKPENNMDINLVELTRLIILNFEVYSHDKNIELVDEFSPIEKVNSDNELLKIILSNLIGNAIKFSEMNSNIYIKTYMDSKNIYWEMIDSGPGFSKDDLKDIFKKFKILSAKPTGGEDTVGLGLYLVKKLCDQLNITITAPTNSISGGAVFKISFPRREPNLY